MAVKFAGDDRPAHPCLSFLGDMLGCLVAALATQLPDLRRDRCLYINPAPQQFLKKRLSDRCRKSKVDTVRL